MLTVSDEAARLKALFGERASMSQREFGLKYKLGSGSMVWQYLHGRRAINLMAGCRFARGLGVDLSQFSPRLASELGEVLEVSSVLGFGDSSRQDYVRVPYVELSLRAGSGEYSTKPLLPAASFIAFRRDWLASRNYSGDKLLAIECPDDGMQPTLSRGDLVIVNISEQDLADSQAYALNYEGQLLIRRIFRDAGAWWLRCDNADSQRFPRKQFVRKHCYLVGKIVHRQSENI